MRTIAVLNQKGGVGKTTTAVNTAASLAAAGSKVVVIDLDPQAHMTIHLGLEPQAIEAGSYKVLSQSAGFEEQIMLVRPNLWLLPANINLVGAESELVSVVGREIILREALESSQDKFDYCFIDCAPSLGLLTLNALAAAREVLIPLQPHFLALQGLGRLLQTIDLVNKRINPNLKVKGILLCMFDSRASLPNEVKADIEQFLDNARGTDSAWAQARIIPTCIRRNIKLAEAPSYGKTIFEYEPNCNGAEDYAKVARCVHADFQPVAEIETPQPVAVDDAQDQWNSQEHPPPQPAFADRDEMQERSKAAEASPPQPQYVDIHEIQDELDRSQSAPLQSDGSFEGAAEPLVVPGPPPRPEPSGTGQSRGKPPIRIEPIGQPHPQTSDESQQTTDEGERRESAQADHGVDHI
ncbi:MAG: ParA family protein [Planctomycetota bacterium]|jgi:chromosome partitioning protein